MELHRQRQRGIDADGIVSGSGIGKNAGDGGEALDAAVAADNHLAGERVERDFNIVGILGADECEHAVGHGGQSGLLAG